MLAWTLELPSISILTSRGDDSRRLMSMDMAAATVAKREIPVSFMMS